MNVLRVNVLLPYISYTGIHLIIKVTGTYIFIQNFNTLRKYALHVLYSDNNIPCLCLAF